MGVGYRYGTSEFQGFGWELRISCDELQTRESLVRMARRITSNVTLREDLLQEALIHLWLTERRRPGQTRSWYLQSCKYPLLHYLASGRRGDSTKRPAGQMLM